MEPDALDLFGGFAGIGVLAAGLGFAYAQFKSGSGKAKDDLIETLKESIEAEKAVATRVNEEKNKLLASHQRQINDLTEKIGKLQGLYEAAEQRSKDYLAILQGRSPEQNKFMTMVTKAITTQAKENTQAQAERKQMTSVLREIHTSLQNLNKTETMRIDKISKTS